MTKKEFERKYPNGLNEEIYRFMEALEKVMTTDEIDHIVKSAKFYRKYKVKKFTEAYNILHKVYGGLGIPIWAILRNMPVEVLQDVIAFMVLDCNEIYTGENEE